MIANHARSKVETIRQKFENDEASEAVTVGMDKYDQAAVQGKYDQEICDLATAAFPNDLFDLGFTICSILDDSVLEEVGKYYVEKVTRFEAKARGA